MRASWLAPLGSLFGGVATARAALYQKGWLRQSSLKGPVVSVGNLNVGGSGKTPVVALIAKLVKTDGRVVSILSRGYGGSYRGEGLIGADGQRLLADIAGAGDEPVMLARNLPGVVVAVGPRRDLVGRVVERQFGLCVHILDDGFQHFRLARDVDVVCVSRDDLTDLPLPAGRLREAPRALARANAILLQKDGYSAEEWAAARAQLGRERTFLLSRAVLGFFNAAGEEMLRPARAFILSGIARPERLRADLASLGTEVVGHTAFADHHRFTAGDLASVVKDASEGRVDAIVTTEKDLPRLPFIPEAPPLRVMRIAARIEDEAAFFSIVRRGLLKGVR
jgi:tetraacyldisaccharide 4'-kinase